MLNNIEEKRYDNILNLFLQIYCFILPFEEALAGSFGSVVKLVGVTIMVYVILIYKKVTLHRYIYPVIAWIALAALSVAWSASFDLWVNFFKIYLSQFLFLLIVTGVDSDQINIQGVRRAMIAGATLASAILILMPQMSDFTSDGRRTIILLGHTFDPNIVASIILLGIMAAMEELFLANILRRRLRMFFIILFCFVGVFYTGSRGGLIATIVACAVSLLMEMKNRENRKFVRRIILFSAIACVVIIPLLPESMLENRFSMQTILGLNEYTKGVHNRYSIWLSALKLIPDRPMLGYGVGNFMDAITQVYFRSCASHNLVILLTIETGLVGLCIFASFYLCIVNKAKKYSLYTTCGLLSGIFIVSLTLDALPYKFFWVALMYSALQINEKSNRCSNM